MKLLVIFTISIFLLFVSPNLILAQRDPLENPDRPYMIDGEGNGVNPGDKKKTSNEIFEDFLDIFFKPPKFDNTNSNPTNNSGSNSTLTPLPSGATQFPNQTTPNLSPVATPVPGSYIMNRQCDYKSIMMPDGCSICYAGCGPSAVSNIVANLGDPNATPPSIISKYYGSKFGENRYASCAGSTLQGALFALNGEGFRSEIIPGFQRGTPQQVAAKLMPFVKSGSWIIAGGDFTLSGKTVGHFFVITDIVQNGKEYDIYGLDSTFGDRNTRPLNYRFIKDLQVVKFAAAVRRK